MYPYYILAKWALIFAFFVVAPAYAALLALVNVAYRLKSGRFFRWVSWRTFAPFLLLLLACAGFIFYTFTRPGAFVITH
ncbi:MAG: hypothetical protein JOZ96_28740 [Acidobacteria bacterium]|nr:hypothetical protein [Acidobacteriota bacterium]MBV9929035.1 hypothetical protein [Acidobacteriota bacterium]